MKAQILILEVFLLLLLTNSSFAQTKIFIEKSGSALFLKWPSAVNVVYDVQFSYDLQNWTTSNTAKIGTGAEISVPLSDVIGFPNVSRAFFRLRITSTGGDFIGNDSDGDGIPNSFEIQFGLNPTDPSDATTDDDGDGISNFNEFLNGTDPSANDQAGGVGGGGGGSTYSGIIPIPTNAETPNHIGTGAQGVRTNIQQTYNWSDGSSGFFILVGMYSEEYPTYTMDGSQFNDIVDYSISPSTGNSISGSVNVNSLHSSFGSEGKSFDLGAGSKFYFFKEQKVIKNSPRGVFTIQADLGATNVADGALPSGVTVGVYPVQIQPTQQSANSLGSLIMSNSGKSGEKHFVSSKKNSSLNDDKITFEVTGISKQIFDEFLQWEGGQAVSGDTLKREVDRSSAAKTELKIKVKKTNDEVDKLNVWVVWASLTGNVQNPVSRNIASTSGYAIGTSVSANYNCTASIQPTSIITDSDRPNLTGANVSGAPGGQNAAGISLAGGANKKWDMSRRISRNINIQANPALILPNLDKNIIFPGDKVVGNDDSGTGDEDNDPYSRSGTILSSDRPTRSFTLQGGVTGDTYQNNTSFEEFSRLEISGNWFLISDPEPWFVNFNFIKQNISENDWSFDANGDGDTNDIVSEQGIGRDTNGDGDSNDSVSRWNNNNTNTQN